MNAVSEKTREIVMQYSGLYGNIEKIAEMTISDDNKSLSNNNLCGGDDPCELRQTAGYRFGYATRINGMSSLKSSLIDSEAYLMQEAA